MWLDLNAANSLEHLHQASKKRHTLKIPSFLGARNNKKGAPIEVVK
jgi:hypothetical protein